MSGTLVREEAEMSVNPKRYGDVVLSQFFAEDVGPEWLTELRARGRATHGRIGVPTPKHEDWKYTPLREVAETSWRKAEPGPAVFESQLPSYDKEAVRVVLVDGRLDRNLGSGERLPAGLRLKSLRDAIEASDPVLESVLGKTGPKKTQTVGREIVPDEHTFGALNDAAFADGLLVHIAAGAEIAPLIEIVHVCCADDSPSLVTPRIAIVAEEGSRCRIVETYVSEGEGDVLVLPVTEVSVRSGAEVEHVRVQDESLDSRHIGLWQTSQAPGSTYTSFNVCFGARLARVDQGVWIGGEATRTRLDGVVVATGCQHMDNHTRLDHAFPNGESFEIYKQIADDEAHIVFNGKIFVHQDAQKTDAKQTNQALLLAPGAVIDSKPQLEIFADDVKCTHGATVGQLEDLPLFYLRSRGMPKDKAEAVLVYAFAAEVLETISIEPVRDALEARLFEKLAVVSR